MKVKTPVSTPMVTVRTDKPEDLVSAAGKKAEQLSSDTGSHHVLVVYQDGAAKIFCEPPEKKAKKEPQDAQGLQVPLRGAVTKGN